MNQVCHFQVNKQYPQGKLAKHMIHSNNRVGLYQSGKANYMNYLPWCGFNDYAPPSFHPSALLYVGCLYYESYWKDSNILERKVSSGHDTKSLVSPFFFPLICVLFFSSSSGRKGPSIPNLMAVKQHKSQEPSISRFFCLFYHFW